MLLQIFAENKSERVSLGLLNFKMIIKCFSKYSQRINQRELVRDY